MPRVPESPGVSVLQEGRLGYANFDPTPIDRGFVRQQKETDEAFARFQKVQKKIRQEAVDTRASDIANQYYRTVTRKMTGKDGALTKKAADVTAGYNGKNYVDGYMSEFRAIGRDLISTVKDPEIVEAAIRKMSNFDNQFTSMLSAHEGQETRNHQMNTANENIAVAQEQAATSTNPNPFYWTIHEQEKFIADLNGIDVNSPNGKAYVRRQAQAKMAQPIANAIEHFVLNNDFPRARDYLRSAAAGGIIDGDTNTKLANEIDKQWTAYRTDQKAEWGASEMVKMWEPSYSVLQSAPEASRGWIQEYEGEIGGAKGVDGLMADFGGAQGALVASCFPSLEAMESARDAAEKAYGDKVTPEKMLEFNEQAKNQYTRVMNRYKTATATFREPNATDAYAWAQRYAKDETPEVRAKIAEGILSRWKLMRAERDVESAAALTNALNDIKSGNTIMLSNHSIPYLSGVQTAKYQRIVDKGLRDELNAPSDARMLEDLWNDPSALINMSETDFLLLQADLSASDFAMLEDRRDALKGKPPKGIGTDLVSSAIDMAAANIGFTEQLKEDKMMRAMYESVFYEELSKLNMQRGPGGGKITLEEATAYVQKRMDTVVGGTRRKPLRAYQITAKDIPNPIKRYISVQLGRREEDISDQVYVSSFHRFYANPFTPDIPLAIPQPTRARIENMYVQKTGKKPSAETVKQIFFDMEMGNMSAVDAAMGKVPTPAAGTYSATYSANDEFGDY